jgi:proton-dependent oligopeptide transporter, POT family
MTSTTVDSKLARRDRAFIGHPVGLGWLSSAEFWERFSYYGMTSVLVLFLAHYLLQPGNIEQVMGYELFRDFVVYFRGQATTPDDMAVAITGLYSTVVYVTPLIGGYVADRIIGRTWAVASGAVLMSAGLFMMMVDSLFVPALLVQVLGVGFFKGNIAAQVGDLYSHNDSRRADGFQIYFLGIQMSAIVTPIVCGYLYENWDPHGGFLAAGIGMLIGLVIYLIGRYSYPPEPFHKKKEEIAASASTPRRRLTGRDWATVVLLIVLLPILALSILGNQEIFNAYLLWSEKSFDLNFFGVELPVSTLISLDAFISLFLMMGVIAFWRWYAKRWTEPVELTKMIIGTAIGALAPLALMGAAAMVESTGQKVPIAWGVLFHVINDLGFAMVLPVGLALYSRLAPAGLGGIMIAIYYLHIAASNFLVGMLGAPSDAGVQFWLMIAGLVGGAAVALLIMRVAFASYLAPAFEKRPAPA